MFLNTATCYVITPHTHQWYQINTKEILQVHELALCDDEVAQMVPSPPDEPPPINAYIKILRVKLQQNQDSQNNAHDKQPPEWSYQSQNVHPHDQSTVIQQQFSIITHMMAKENTSGVVQDAISQALAKPQDSTTSRTNPPRELRNLNLNQVLSSWNDVNIVASLQMDDFGVAPHLGRDAYHSQVPQETATFSHTQGSNSQQ